MHENITGSSPPARWVVDVELALRSSLEKAHHHVEQLSDAHGPALVAVLHDFLAELSREIDRAAAEVSTRFDAYDRTRTLLANRRDALEFELGAARDALAAITEELERRNRRSHAAPSRDLARARKLLDQLAQDAR